MRIWYFVSILAFIESLCCAYFLIVPSCVSFLWLARVCVSLSDPCRLWYVVSFKSLSSSVTGLPVFLASSLTSAAWTLWTLRSSLKLSFIHYNLSPTTSTHDSWQMGNCQIFGLWFVFFFGQIFTILNLWSGAEQIISRAKNGPPTTLWTTLC